MTNPTDGAKMLSKTTRRLIAVAVLSMAVAAAFSQDGPRILIVYYSQAGHTRAMAESVAQGARSVEGSDVVLLSVDQATTDDLLGSDAIILGSPVYNANVAPEVQRFINSWPFQGGPLADKLGAAFTSGGGISAGEELVQLNILHSMLMFGMIVVGGPDWTQPFGASAVTEEPPFHKGDTEEVSSAFLQKAFALGKRVATIAHSLRNN